MLGISAGTGDYISPWLLDQQLRERKCSDYSSLCRVPVCKWKVCACSWWPILDLGKTEHSGTWAFYDLDESFHVVIKPLSYLGGKEFITVRSLGLTIIAF